jgi:glutathione synthase/RimK-type ligase-like ATP-grasp enzyme
MILIFSNSADFHTDAVINQINAADGKFFRLNTEWLHRDYEFTLYPNEKRFEIKNTVNGKVACSSDITCAWWRRPEKIKISEKDAPKMLHAFLTDEYRLVLRGLINILEQNNCRIVTDPSILNRAKDKTLQQIWAAECGFKLPSQIITTSNQAFGTYFKKEPQLISKSIDSIESIRDEERKKDFNLFANVIPENIRDQIENNKIKINVSYFQSKIQRNHELRVIAFGQYVYPFVIDDSGYDVDWRRVDPDSIDFKLSHHTSVAQKCLDYLQLSGLAYGAFDIIVDNNNECFFIECNPNGQFLFCDITGKTDLLKDFVSYLLHG